MRPNRIRTSTAAKIYGVDSPYLIEKIRTGEYPIGYYQKNGKRANVVIQTNLVARHLERSMEDIDAAIEEIERGGETVEKTK